MVEEGEVAKAPQWLLGQQTDPSIFIYTYLLIILISANNYFILQKLELFSEEFLELRSLVRKCSYFAYVTLIWEMTIIGMIGHELGAMSAMAVFA